MGAAWQLWTWLQREAWGLIPGGRLTITRTYTADFVRISTVTQVLPSIIALSTQLDCRLSAC